MDALAIVVENGMQVQHPQDTLTARKTGRTEQGEGANIVSSGVLDFFWRMITRVTEFVTRIRRLFVFTPAKEGSLEVKEERGTSEKDIIKVEEGPVQAYGACQPELAEIMVSKKDQLFDEPGMTNLQEATNHSQDFNAESNAVELYHEDCGSKYCTLQIKVDEQSGTCDAYKATPSVDNHGARKIEYSSPTEQATSDPCLQEPFSVTCEPVKAFPLELNDEHCTADSERQKRQTHEQNASQEEKLLNVAISNNKCDLLQAPSPLSVAFNSELDKSVEDSSLEPLKLTTSSKSLKEKVSIQHLNAIVGEQLTKYLQVLERSNVSGKAEHSTWNHRTTHRRAIILATLVAVAVWARNAKHLHESMPRIKGSALNVHIRSRL